METWNQRLVRARLAAGLQPVDVAKRVVIDGGHRYLRPDNPRYPILQMADDAVFCGVAVQVNKDLV